MPEERIALMLPELMNYRLDNEEDYKKIATEWVAFGLRDHMEVWDWMCNGYTDPERVAYLKGQGQTVLGVTNYTEAKILAKYGYFAEVKIKEDMDSINLEHLKVYKKKKGMGTLILGNLCNIADSLRKDIVITPSDEHGSNLEWLISFYKRYGFVSYREKSMIRQHE